MFWTVLEECVDRSQVMFRPRSRYVLTVLEVCFDDARCMPRPCCRYVLTILEVCSTVLEKCFDRS